MSAAQEIGSLVNRILELAPSAGLYVGITIKPASADTHPKDGNSTEIEVPLVSGAVAANSSETPNLSAEGDS